MTEKYNKLVRDKIPEIIMQKGDEPIVEILDGENYFKALNKKLEEELEEYLEEYDIEELADMVEVIYAIVKYKGMTQENFEDIRLEKNKERGSFDDRLALLGVTRK